MPCIPLPKAPAVAVPSPFSVVPPEPELPNFAANICCNSIAVDIPPIPYPMLSYVITPAVVKSIQEVTATLDAYEDALQPPCYRGQIT